VVHFSLDLADENMTRFWLDATLTRFAALSTLSRDAGEGLLRIRLKAPLPQRGRGGTSPHGSTRSAARGQAPGLVGEGDV